VLSGSAAKELINNHSKGHARLRSHSQSGYPARLELLSHIDQKDLPPPFPPSAS
jgi:hypothetical protein